MKDRRKEQMKEMDKDDEDDVQAVRNAAISVFFLHYVYLAENPLKELKSLLGTRVATQQWICHTLI